MKIVTCSDWLTVFQGKSIINLPENLAGSGTGLKLEMETPGERVEIKGKEKVMRENQREDALIV